MLTQVNTQSRLGLCTHERIRHLQQQPATVTGAPVCGNPAAVRHAGQGLDGGLQQAMTGLALNMGDQAKTTIIPKLVGAVETARGCRTRIDAARIYSMIHRSFRY